MLARVIRIMPDSLLLLDGVFSYEKTALTVFMDGKVHNLDACLVDWVDRSVILQLHHLPPQPVNLSLPGGGSCLWGGFCPHGHREHPGWLHSQSLTGTLRGGPVRNWKIDDVPLRFDLMPGHYGRIIVCPTHLDDNTSENGDTSVDHLLREIEQTASLLEALKGVLR